MTEKIPPTIETDEIEKEIIKNTTEQTAQDIKEDVSKAIDNETSITHENTANLDKLEDDLDLEIKYQASNTVEAIRKAQQKKGVEVEKWDTEEVTKYNTPPKQVPSNKFRNFLMATKIGLAGILGLGATKEAKAGGPTDSLNKKPLTEKNNPADSLEAKKTATLEKITAINENGKEVGGIKIEGRYLVPYHNKSVEVCVVYITGNEKDKNKAGQILSAMSKDGGWEPAPGDILKEVAEENKDFTKKMPSVMSLEAINDDDDTRMSERTTLVGAESKDTLVKKDSEGKEKKMIVTMRNHESVIPAHAVFPTHSSFGMNRFESDQGITYGQDGYGYIFYRKVNTEYQSGIVKAK